MSFDSNPANGNNLAFYRATSSSFPIGQILNDGPQTLTLLANNFYDGTNYRSTFGAVAYPTLSLGSVAGTFVSSSNGILLGFFPTTGAPNTILGSFAETVLCTPTATEFYTPTNVKTPLGLLSIYNTILGAQPQIQTVVNGAGDSFLAFGTYLTPAGTALSSGNFDNFRLYQFASSLFIQRRLATPAGTPISATTTNIAEFNFNGEALYSTGNFAPANSLFLAPLGAGSGGALLMDGYMDTGTVRASLASTPIVSLRKTTNEFSIQYSNGGAASSAPPLRTLMRLGSSLSASQPLDFVENTGSTLVRPSAGSNTGNLTIYSAEFPTAPQIQIFSSLAGSFTGLFFGSYLTPALAEVSSISTEVAGSLVKVADSFVFRLQSADVPINTPLGPWIDHVTIRRTETEFRLPPAVTSYSGSPSVVISDATKHIVESSVSFATLLTFPPSAYQAAGVSTWFIDFRPGAGCSLFGINTVAIRATWIGHLFTITIATSSGTFNSGGGCVSTANGALIDLSGIAMSPSSPGTLPLCTIGTGLSGGFANNYQCCYDSTAKQAQCFVMSGASPGAFLSGTTYRLPLVLTFSWVTTDTP
jgi:hypothetical protein